MPATPRQEPQEEILEAALATLTEADVPPDEADIAGWADPDCGRPDELAGLTEAELEERFAVRPAPVADFGPAGFLLRDGSGGGAGFADGGALDVLAPGACLAGFADDAHARLAALTDDELIGVIRGWRRQTSWAQARELAAITELARRRPADGTPPAAAAGQFPPHMSQFIADEMALALTLTGRSAEAELDLALGLAERPTTFAALETGRIDLPRAKIITEGVGTLAAGHANAVEAAVLPRAPAMTTGQLRAAVARAVLAVDPDAARRRREEAEKEARVDCWPEPCGAASLAGWHLPSAQALAADKRLGQIAAAWKRRGAAGETDLLRARAYLALLLGLPIDAPPADLLPPAGPSARASAPGDPGLRDNPGLPPLAGTVNLTVPLTTLLGLSRSPGQAAGYGPLDADTARALACAAAGHRATRWQITLTAADGTALAHGAGARRHRENLGRRWAVSVTAEPVATGSCDHRHCEPGYRPSPALLRLIRARSSTCTVPGCRRPAAACDIDHTRAYDEDGWTCECNLAPLCRRHHRLKQAGHWTLEQPGPGVMAWLTPAGRRYSTLPSRHPT